MVFCAGDDSAPPTVRAPQVAGRTTEPPGREILRGELRGHVWWAARTGGRGQCLGVGGAPHRPCPAVLCGSLDQAVPEELGSWPPCPLVVRQEKVCAARRRVLSCDGCPSGCKPVSHCCCERAGHQDMGESGSVIDTT
ncbi:g4399 [Coccomyxa elongata]